MRKAQTTVVIDKDVAAMLDSFRGPGESRSKAISRLIYAWKEVMADEATKYADGWGNADPELGARVLSVPPEEIPTIIFSRYTMLRDRKAAHISAQVALTGAQCVQRGCP